MLHHWIFIFFKSLMRPLECIRLRLVHRICLPAHQRLPTWKNTTPSSRAKPTKKRWNHFSPPASAVWLSCWTIRACDPAVLFDWVKTAPLCSSQTTEPRSLSCFSLRTWVGDERRVRGGEGGREGGLTWAAENLKLYFASRRSLGLWIVQHDLIRLRRVRLGNKSQGAKLAPEKD